MGHRIADRPPRRAVPLRAQRDAALLQLAELMRQLGYELEAFDEREPAKAFDLDHDPALGLRPVNAAGTDYDPPQHDHRKLVWRPKKTHGRKTNGVKLGESRFARRVEGDKQAIARTKHLEEARLQREAAYRSRLLAPGTPDPDAAPERPKPRYRWPQGRKIPSRKSRRQAKR